MARNPRFPLYLGDDEVVSLQRRITEIALAALARQLGLLIGAGFSFEARGLPLGSHLAVALAEDLGYPEISARRLADTYGLSVIAEQYGRVVTGKRQQLVDTVSRMLTTSGDGSQVENDLKAIVSNCDISRIFTTNYDSLIETALGDQRSATIAETASALTKFEHDIRRKEFTGVFHIHGTTTNPVITETDLQKPRSIFFEELRHELLSRVFVMVGYSFRDESITDVFESIYELLKKTREERKTFLVSPIEEEFEYRFAKQYWEDRCDVCLIPMGAGAFFAEFLEQLHTVGSVKPIDEISVKIRSSPADVKERLKRLCDDVPDLALDDMAEIARRFLAVRTP